MTDYYAIAEIIESPKNVATPPDIGYWIDTSRASNRTYAKIRFTSKLLEKPLLRENLKQDPIVQHLMVIRVPNGKQIANNSNGPGTAIPALFTKPKIPAPPTAFVTVSTADAIDSAHQSHLKKSVSAFETLSV